MRHPSVTLLIAFVFTASGLTPVCEISCALAQERTIPASAAAAPGNCHQSAGETSSGQGSSNQHPCKKGVHHRGELSVSPTVSTQMHSAGDSGYFAGFCGWPALKAASTARLESAWSESLSPPTHRLAPLFLRI
jgi:hypothetical protein